MLEGGFTVTISRAEATNKDEAEEGVCAEGSTSVQPTCVNRAERLVIETINLKYRPFLPCLSCLLSHICLLLLCESG